MKTRGIAISATAALACTFGGIWVVDMHVAQLSGLTYTTLWMRCVSLAVYVAALAIVLSLPRLFKNAISTHGQIIQQRLKVFSLTGLVCLGASIAGAAGLLSGAEGFMGALCAVALKLIGAPLTIALVCCFSHMQREDAAKASLIGISGAFIFESLLTCAVDMGLFSNVGSVVCAFAAMTAALVITYKLIENGEAKTPTEPASIAPVRPAIQRVFVLPFVVVLLATAAMLGFLRGGFEDASAFQSSPIIMAALVAFCFICAIDTVRINLMNLLMTGMVCVAAGFLIGPLAADAVPDATAILAGAGTALLEAAAWCLCARAARESERTLVAAALARTFAVAGHLLGALVAIAMEALSGANTGSLNAGALVIVFGYFVLALLLTRTSTESAARAAQAGSQAENAIQETAQLLDMAPEADVATPDANAAGQATETPEQKRERVLSQVAHQFDLTAREGDVLALLALGRDIATVESELCISRNTAKMHIRHVYQKLGVHSKQELIDLVQAQE